MGVKHENGFEISEFYRSRFSEKVANFIIIKKSKQNIRQIPRFKGKQEEKIEERRKERAPALRVTRAETRLTVYRSLP